MPSVSEMVTDNPVTKGAGEFLTRKYGPLPLWAWMLVVGGTAYGVRRYLDRNQSAADTADAVTEDGVGTAEPGLATYGSGLANVGRNDFGVGAGAGSDSGTSTGDQPEETVQQWQARALQYLTAAGMGGFDAQLAIRKYLANQTVTATEQAWLGKMLGVVGPPPLDLAAPTVATAPKPANVRTAATALSIVQTKKPAKLGGLMEFSIRWYVSGSNQPANGAVEVLMSTDGGRTWQSQGNKAVRNGIGSFSRAAGSRQQYTFRVHTAPNELKYADKSSNALTFDLRKLP